MKKVIAGFLIVQVLSIAVVYTQGIGDSHTHKSLTPRSDQSCAEGPSFPYGYYWDGQKCEKCAHNKCFCKQYNTCESCHEGWVKVSDSENPNGFCVQCPLLNETSYYNGGSNDKSYERDTTFVPQDTSLQIHNTGAVDAIKSCCSMLPTDLKWVPQYRKQLRATECINAKNENEPNYKLFGSICWYMDGCQAYTAVGKCSDCMEGWFLDDNQICRRCQKQCESNADPQNQNVTDALLLFNGGSCTSLQHEIWPCSKCFAHDQCSTCIRGYYLAKTTQYDQRPDDKFMWSSLKHASWCRKCPDNCACDRATDGVSYTNIDVINNQYFKKNNLCFNCSDTSQGGRSNCKTCKYTENIDKFECLSCNEFTMIGNDKRYLTTEPNSQGECKQCPVGCYKCRHATANDNLDNNTVTCEHNHCLNGYREIKTANGIIECVRCQEDKSARCITPTSSTFDELITQCDTAGDKSDISRYEQDVQQGYHNKRPPNSEDYYLIRTTTTQNSAVTKNVCVKNLKKCQKMVEGQTNGNCQSCYPGYILVDTQCYECNEGNCQTCSEGTLFNGGKLQCATCLAGYALDNKVDKQHKCVRCQNNCANCTISSSGQTDGQCQICDQGYWLNKTTGNCQKCALENCAECPNDPKICTKCMDNYRLWQSPSQTESRWNQLCEACEWGCKDCRIHRKECQECRTDWPYDKEVYLWAGVCHRRKDNCIYMVQQTSKFMCKYCETGYRLVDGKCLRCLEVEGGFVHCHQNCDQTNSLWETTVDPEGWRVVPPTPTNPEITPTGPTNTNTNTNNKGSILIVCQFVLLALLFLII